MADQNSNIHIRHPFGLADSKELTATGVQALSINDDFTIIDGVTVEATGNRTLNLTVDSEIKSGARLLLKSKTNGTETTIFGTGITSVTITGVAGKTKTQGFTYDGTAFLPDGTSVQID